MNLCPYFFAIRPSEDFIALKKTLHPNLTLGSIYKTANNYALSELVTGHQEAFAESGSGVVELSLLGVGFVEKKRVVALQDVKALELVVLVEDLIRHDGLSWYIE